MGSRVSVVDDERRSSEGAVSERCASPAHRPQLRHDAALRRKLPPESRASSTQLVRRTVEAAQSAVESQGHFSLVVGTSDREELQLAILKRVAAALRRRGLRATLTSLRGEAGLLNLDVKQPGEQALR